jgi:RNA polymerase sigma factor FliA
LGSERNVESVLLTVTEQLVRQNYARTGFVPFLYREAARNLLNLRALAMASELPFGDATRSEHESEIVLRCDCGRGVECGQVRFNDVQVKLSCAINNDTAQERERLILEHLPQVRLIARRIHERLPESVSLDDLVSTGTLGLIAAIDRFNPAHSVKLKTYAEYKIRGAILDSLRGLDWAPRQQRKRAKQIESAISLLEQRLHASPTEEEIAAELKLSLADYHEWLVEIRGVNLGSLECASADEDGQDLLNYISDDEDHWPLRLLEKSELKRLLAEAMAKIPHTEKIVMSLYYHEELTLREIAKVVSLHESRVSQLKSQAILRLRSYIERRWPMKKGA